MSTSVLGARLRRVLIAAVALAAAVAAAAATAVALPAPARATTLMVENFGEPGTAVNRAAYDAGRYMGAQHAHASSGTTRGLQVPPRSTGASGSIRSCATRSPSACGRT